MKYDREAMERISFIAQKIREARTVPEYREILSRILNGISGKVPERDAKSELMAVFDYVSKAIRVTKDPFGVDLISSVAVIDKQGIGDCDEASVLAGSLLISMGYPVKVRCVSFDGEFYSHVYVLAGVAQGDSGRWVPIDTVYGKFGVALDDQGRIEVLAV